MAAKTGNAKKGGLSPKDTRMVLFLLGIVLVVCAYFFVFRSNSSKTAEINEENESLQLTLDELVQLENGSEATKEETKAMQDEIKEIINQFPSELRQEKVIAIVDDMEEKTEVRVPSISMEMNMPFFTPAADAEAAAAEAAAADAAAEEGEGAEAPAEGEASAEGGVTETKIPDDIITADRLMGYRSDVSIAYSGKYSDVKDLIDYINNSEDKMRINSMNFGFDSATGNLAGTVNISMYSLYGNGKEYVEPKVKNVKIKIDSLFSESAVTEDGDGKKKNNNNAAE